MWAPGPISSLHQHLPLTPPPHLFCLGSDVLRKIRNALGSPQPSQAEIPRVGKGWRRFSWLCFSPWVWLSALNTPNPSPRHVLQNCWFLASLLLLPKLPMQGFFIVFGESQLWSQLWSFQAGVSCNCLQPSPLAAFPWGPTLLLTDFLQPPKIIHTFPPFPGGGSSTAT